MKRTAARSGMVYLATDPDREGEAIAWHLQQALDLDEDRIRRVTFHEITDRAVKEAFSKSGPINMEMVNAQQARRFLDRVVGYQLSPLLWKKVGARNLSAGRVQSVAVRIIADREREIKNFVTEEYWKIGAVLGPQGSTDLAQRFKAALAEYNGSKFEARTEADAHARARCLADRGFSGVEGQRDREARQGRASIQNQQPPAAGGDQASILRQEDHEGCPGALRRYRRRRLRAGRVDHLHAYRQPACL